MSKDKFFEIREQELAEFVSQVENGDIDALSAYANLKEHEKFTSEAVKQIEPLAKSQSEQWSEKSFEHSGFKFEKRNGGEYFNFKGIPDWVQKKSELSDIESIAKQAYKAKISGIMTATEDGEEIVLPEVNYRKDSLVVKRK